MSRSKRSLNPRVLNCESLRAKLRTTWKNLDDIDHDILGIFTDVEIITIYTMFTAETKHSTIPPVRVKGSVPLLLEMFKGCDAEQYALLSAVGTPADPTETNITLNYIVESMTTLQKKGVRQKRSEKEAEFKAMHLAAFVYARKIYTLHKDLTKKQLKDLVKGIQTFCKSEWGGRQSHNKRKRSESFSIEHWLLSKVNDSPECQKAAHVVSIINTRADAQFNALQFA